MARPLRVQVAGGAYHVTTRGVARQAIFRDDVDRERFLAAVAEVVRRHDWSCHAFCLMTTHYHLLVRTPGADLARGMQRLNGYYAQGFNRRHDEEGHVFYRRYCSIHIEREAHLLEVCRYIVLNPVEAGACERPEDWPWSSYAYVLGHGRPPAFLTVEWLLGLFGNDIERARERFRAFVEAGLVTRTTQRRYGV